MEIYITVRSEYSEYRDNEEIDGAFSSYEAAKEFVKRKKDEEYSEKKADLKRLCEIGIVDEDEVKEDLDDFLADVGWYVMKVTIDNPEIPTEILGVNDEED